MSSLSKGINHTNGLTKLRQANTTVVSLEGKSEGTNRNYVHRLVQYGEDEVLEGSKFDKGRLGKGEKRKGKLAEETKMKEKYLNNFKMTHIKRNSEKHSKTDTKRNLKDTKKLEKEKAEFEAKIKKLEDKASKLDKLRAKKQISFEEHKARTEYNRQAKERDEAKKRRTKENRLQSLQGMQGGGRFDIDFPSDDLSLCFLLLRFNLLVVFFTIFCNGAWRRGERPSV